MGFLNKFFGGKQKRLIDVVKKTHNQPEGVFANINNDLNMSITEDNPPMILMAYAYARRTAAAGLFLQGVFTRENYTHAARMFKTLQINTYQKKPDDPTNIQFQEEAGQQSYELLSSYDRRLDKNFAILLTTLVENAQGKKLKAGMCNNCEGLIVAIQTMKNEFFNN